MPSFPDRFGCIEEARAFLIDFFAWYNDHHRHSGIAFVTQADVHFGRAPHFVAARQCVLDTAYAAYPERFSRRAPRANAPATNVWINQSTTAVALTSAGTQCFPDGLAQYRWHTPSAGRPTRW